MIPAEFIRMAEHATALPAGTVAGSSRLKRHVHVRTAIVHILRGMVRVDPDTGVVGPRFSLTVIGTFVARDHSTVTAAVDRAERLLASNSRFAELVAQLQALAQAQDLSERLIAARIAAQVAADTASAPHDDEQIRIPSAREFAAALKRKVKHRNDMLADDDDAILRARASISLAAAIAAARAAA